MKEVPLSWRQRIVRVIDLLPEDPYRGEKLWGRLRGKRKIRVWPYRIIYSFDHKRKIILILEIGQRQGMYK